VRFYNSKLKFPKTDKSSVKRTMSIVNNANEIIENVRLIISYFNIAGI
jgi:hypothetical protein